MAPSEAVSGQLPSLRWWRWPSCVNTKDNADPLQCTVQQYLAWAQWAAGPECPAHNPGLEGLTIH